MNLKIFGQLNPFENLPQTITLNISTRKIDSAKGKQDIRRISCKNSGKFPQCQIAPEKFTPGDFLPHGKPHKHKDLPPSPPEKCRHTYPITNTIRKQWNILKVKYLSPEAVEVQIFLKAFLFGLSTMLNNMIISNIWLDDFGKKGCGREPSFPQTFLVTSKGHFFLMETFFFFYIGSRRSRAIFLVTSKRHRTFSWSNIIGSMGQCNHPWKK